MSLALTTEDYIYAGVHVKVRWHYLGKARMYPFYDIDMGGYTVRFSHKEKNLMHVFIDSCNYAISSEYDKLKRIL